MLTPFLSPVRELLSEAEVGQADVSFAVQQDVLRLKVAVDDFFGVKVLYGAYNLRGIEEAGAVAEAPPAAQVAEELAAWHVVHQHVEEALVVVRPEPVARAENKDSSISAFLSRLLPNVSLASKSVNAPSDELRKSDKIRSHINIRLFVPTSEVWSSVTRRFQLEGTSEE